ncbi:ABC transporter ATP-binding protein [Microbacterium sp. C7(2022)]|uniref:ABC transporter ATP-binding protein n=1 Tax=Microbacterium sp. C7(2022) TaxID=2992759 RepID=UPI00237A8D9B|nr:ABC transporter ATP-binding protein [Microbacterium sp. C7(2022)]MDE0546049.1 ABC transporter ATP-binding protein [Microbacterium sp. C7(2022)]
MTASTSVATDRGVRTTGLTRVFGTGDAAVHALKGVDLEIASGELVVILGPSGSGKTTLCNILGGIDRATDGTVIVAGEDISTRDPGKLSDFRRDHVGFIFQFFNLIPTLTARENVEVIIEMTGRGDKARVPELLEAVGLGDRMDNFPAQLSGGQQQRVAVARALATDPDILFADEPTGALDLPTGRQILGLLQDLHHQGRTVIIVTHNLSVAQIADRVVTIVDGQVESTVVNDNPAAAADVTW